MEWDFGELLFYGGIGIAAAALLAGILFFCISRKRRARLNAQFDIEYGKENRSNASM